MKRSSMVKSIPLKLRREMQEDLFYWKCCLESPVCAGRIEWHHNLIYAGKRQNAKFCILSVCHFHHDNEATYKKELNKIMMSRATEEDKKKYPHLLWK